MRQRTMLASRWRALTKTSRGADTSLEEGGLKAIAPFVEL